MKDVTCGTVSDAQHGAIIKTAMCSSVIEDELCAANGQGLVRGVETTALKEMPCRRGLWRCQRRFVSSAYEAYTCDAGLKPALHKSAGQVGGVANAASFPLA